MLTTFLLALAAITLQGGQELRPALLHQPDLHGDSVVFVHQRDLWIASTGTGEAHRLTSHEGQESAPRFSPDGARIAFSAEYDGNTDLYVMDRDGSDICRVTWHPGNDVLVDWHPDGQRLLFQSSRVSFQRFVRLFLIGADGRELEELPLHEAAWGSYSPDGRQLVYNRVAREQRTWKRYRGGLAQDLWHHDFETGDDRRLTAFEGTDRAPMWYRGGSVFFTSDRTYQLNLHRMNVSTEEVEAVTFHDDYDVLNPALGDGDRIVYECGGSLWIHDILRGESRRLAIRVALDAPEARPFRKDVSEEVTQTAIAPNGARALIVARGEVFSVPHEHGPTRNLTRTSGAREKDAVWSPDGTQVAYVSDASGNYCLYVADALGQGAEKVSDHADGYRHTLLWSQDGKKIAFADQTLRFYVLDLASREVTEVDRSTSEPVDIGIDLKPIHDYAWSADSKWIAYSKIDADLVSKVYVYSVEGGGSRCVSHGLYNDFGPCFSRDGKYLFFVSNRRFDPTYCDFEWEMVYKKAAGIYSVALAADTAPLLAPRNDEAVAAGDADAEAGAMRIDFDGIVGRTEVLPLPAGNYRRLKATADALFFLDAEKGDFNRFEYRGPGSQDLYAYGFESRSAALVLKGTNSYSISHDGSSLVYQQGSKVGILPTSARDSSGSPLDLGDLEMTLDPRAEWLQIYDEAWRMERDFFYEPGMHGMDWDAVGDKYRALLAGATCRDDLSFLVGEMIGELDTSHTYVMGGDSRKTADRVSIGLLGADWSADPASGRYVVTRVYATPDWTNEVWPPLAGPGVDVVTGDRLISVDGREVTAAGNLYAPFEGLAGEQVEVTFERDGRGRATFTMTPVSSERTLRYRDWIETNRRIVDEASNGMIGYLHLPDTYLGSAVEFPPYFYGQTQKKGLIVDGRFNGGGLDPDIFLQRLDKQLLTWWTRRYSVPQTTPYMITRAHLVCLTNKYAGSGGDMLPMEFQMKKMGPVIGTRTWGGLVGVSMFYSMIDGGGLTAPDYRIYTPEGKWIVENRGITPDIEVDLSPKEMARGHDAQLLKGVEVLIEKIRAEPLEPVAHPEFPDRSK